MDWSSEYYLKDYFIKSNLIRSKNFLHLDTISFITDGEHGSPEWDDRSNITYITAEFIKPNYIENGNFKKISAIQDYRNARARVQKDDILIYSVGAYAGYTARAEKHLLPANIPRSVALVRLTDAKINSEYLSFFLNSEFGVFQTTRFRAGNSQPVLALEKIKQFEIPVLGSAIQTRLKDLYNLAYDFRQKSQNTYSSAESLLLDTLGLQGFTASEESVNIKSFKDSFLATGRLDAEYYQKKYEDIENKIKSYFNGYKSISDVLLQPIKNGTTPPSVVSGYQTKEYYFTRIEAFEQNLQINEEQFYSLDKNDFIKYNANLVITNDILVSMTGTIGAVAIYTPMKPALINQNIMRLRVNNDILNKETLALYLKSIGKIFLERVQTGNVQPYVNTSNFETLVIPIIDKPIQKKIASLIEKSFTQKKESDRLLEKAKRAVEIAIEKDEKEALRFIESE